MLRPASFSLLSITLHTKSIPPGAAVADTSTTSGDLHNITISNLTADTEYTVIVTSKASDRESGGFIRGAGVNYTTLTLQPGKYRETNHITE